MAVLFSEHQPVTGAEAARTEGLGDLAVEGNERERRMSFNGRWDFFFLSVKQDVVGQ